MAVRCRAAHRGTSDTPAVTGKRHPKQPVQRQSGCRIRVGRGNVTSCWFQGHRHARVPPMPMVHWRPLNWGAGLIDVDVACVVHDQDRQPRARYSAPSAGVGASASPSRRWRTDDLIHWTNGSSSTSRRVAVGKHRRSLILSGVVQTNRSQSPLLVYAREQPLVWALKPSTAGPKTPAAKWRLPRNRLSLPSAVSGKMKSRAASVCSPNPRLTRRSPCCSSRSSPSRCRQDATLRARSRELQDANTEGMLSVAAKNALSVGGERQRVRAMAARTVASSSFSANVVGAPRSRSAAPLT